MSSVNPVASSSLPPSGFPRDSLPSPGFSAGVGPYSTLRPTGPRISVGDCPGVSDTSSAFRDDSFPFTDVKDKGVRSHLIWVKVNFLNLSKRRFLLPPPTFPSLSFCLSRLQHPLAQYLW